MALPTGSIASNANKAYRAYNSVQRMTFLQSLAYGATFFKPRKAKSLTDSQWVALITELLYPKVKELRDVSSEAARDYYDAERLDHATGRHDIYLAHYEPQWLLDSMEPVRERFQAPDTPQGAVTEAAGITSKEVQNGARSTLRNAVEDDTKVQGWARAQGGTESCAFCWMLISRGPVFKGGKSAGLVSDDISASDVLNASDDKLDALVSRWHPMCDCRVVPVFDKGGDWPGKDDWKAAEKEWADATRGEDDPFNAFRRSLEGKK